jgi:hypothetical protein
MTVISQPKTKSDPFYRVMIGASSSQLELLSDLLLQDSLFRAQLDDALSNAIAQAVEGRTGRLEAYVVKLDMMPCIRDSRQRVLASREKHQKMRSLIKTRTLQGHLEGRYSENDKGKAGG